MFATAFLDLPALDSASGSVTLPGSKSISNRVLLLAALCEGRTTLHDVLDSDDTRVMLASLRQLGCAVEQDGATVHITGLGGQLPVAQAELFLGNAGTAMRPLTAALAVLGGDYTLKGVARMHERPIGDLVDALRELGCQIDYLGNAGFPPLHIGHAQLRLDAPIPVRGDVSSQFLTALLMALPLVAVRDIHIDVVGELISKPYIEITLQLLQRFGVAVQRQGWQRFTIPAGSRLRSPGTLHVEADASSASYFIALGAIAARASGQKSIKIQGVGADSIQGDIRFVEAARAMGAVVDSGPNWLQVRQGAWPLQAIDLDCNHIPDAAMTLAVMALYADGTTTLRNIASWRVKETDRIAAMACELRKLGATVVEGEDFIQVTPPTKTAPSDAGPPQVASGWKAASIHTYDDHRMAMCFSLAAFNPACLPVRIEDPKCVAKTFPDYFEALFSVAQAHSVPVLCVDGPSASGKGTLAVALAQRLGYHFLDSGSLYRITGLAARRAGIAIEPENAQAIAALLQTLPIHFEGSHIWLGGEDVNDAIRTEQAGLDASRVSAFAPVREALVGFQRGFARLPGLVADGRDMGTVIFPQAPLKVFLTASAAQRAQRRHDQLLSKGIPAKIDSLRADLEARDARDTQRSVAPLKPAQDAMLLDNSELTVQDTVARVLGWWQSKQPFGQRQGG
ncbi:MAG: bifunctional 3-phosphoshikimate 1-carboxyvinyltransferase/cytidylate kinase [Rhodoferax sp.]